MSDFKVWECQVCNWVYDEAKGCPEEGLAPGTRWADIPDDWACPECGVDKAGFDMFDKTSEPNRETQPESGTAGTVSQTDPIVIIGSGIAAYTLIKELRKLNTATDIIVYTRDDGAFYSKPKLSNSLSKGATAEQISSASAEQQAELYNLSIRSFTRVTNVDTANKKISIEGSETQRYSKLVFATGALPRTPTLEGSAATKIYSINNLEDYDAFQSHLKSGSRVAIIGAGLVGCEFADDLSHGDYSVDLIDPGKLPLASLIPQRAGEKMAEKLSDAGIRFHFGSTVEKLDQSNSGIQLLLSNGESIEADIVLSAIGLTPNTQLAREAGLACQHGIMVNETLQTSQADIFALGDCAEVLGRYLPYIDPIIPQARTLARVLTGQMAILTYEPMPVYVKSKHYPISVITPRQDNGEWVVDQDDEEGLIMRCVNEDGAQLGFVATQKASRQAYQLAQSNTFV